MWRLAVGLFQVFKTADLGGRAWSGWSLAWHQARPKAKPSSKPSLQRSQRGRQNQTDKCLFIRSLMAVGIFDIGGKGSEQLPHSLSFQHLQHRFWCCKGLETWRDWSSASEEKIWCTGFILCFLNIYVIDCDWWYWWVWPFTLRVEVMWCVQTQHKSNVLCGLPGLS